METPKGLKHILLDVLGLPSAPGGFTEQIQEQQAAGNSADADVPLEQQPADAGAAHQADASRDDHDAAFAARLAHISKQFASDASAAKDAQQFLQEAHKQAQLKETEVLAAADAAYTPAWRRTGLPSKASQLQLDDAVLSGSRLLNPAAIAEQQRAHQKKEVLQPPAVFAYCDKSAAPHFLQTTGNQKVREGIAAARNAARSQRPPSPKRLQQLEQQVAAQRHGSPARAGRLRTSPARSQRQSGQQGAADGTAQQTPAGRVPWKRLPADEAAAKVAAATARYKAMAAIMTPEQQMIEEKIIKSMYQRLSFLRNPRYAVQQGNAGHTNMPLKGSSTAHKRHKSTQASSKSSAAQPAQYDTRSSMTTAEAGFSVVPAQGVLFDAYEPGGAYFQTVQLQNVGTVMKQLRLLPPSSRYFQISFPRFPLESSLLAPGVCAEVDVCFMPDSLGDYEDAFSVESPAGRFEVQLKGRRPHPELTLPPVLELGDVLVGNSRSRTFEFVNQGGDGRFLLLTAQQWAATLQQHGHDPSVMDNSQSDASAAERSSTDVKQVPALDGTLVQAAAGGLHAAEGCWEAEEAPAAVTSGPFSISPAYLDLPASAAAVLAVDFSPKLQGPQSADFVLVCDNCTAHPLRVEGCGEQVRVQLVGLDDREWLPQDAQMPLWFGQLKKELVSVALLIKVCPGSSSTRQLRVRNGTELPFPFKWTVQGCSPAAFTVSPAAGVLQPQAEQVFNVEFAPPSVAAHSAGLTLSVQRSGDAGLLSISQWGKEGTAVIDLAASASTTVGASAAGPFLPGNRTISSAIAGGLAGSCAAGTSSGPAWADDLHCSSSVLQPTWPGASAWESVAQLDVEGRGCPISLTVLPTAALRVPGVLTVRDEACLPVQLCNDTAAPAHFRVVAAGRQGAVAAADVCILPSEGVIAAHSVLQLAVHFTALAAGTRQKDFTVEVLHGQVQQLHTYVDVQQVRVVPSIPTLDFGVLCVGASASRTLQLQSTAANSSSYWCLQQCGEQDAVPPTVLSFQPASGCLDPLASCRTLVTVTGSCEGAQKLLIRISSNSAACSSCTHKAGSCRHSRGDGPATAQLPACSCSVEYVQVLVMVSSPKVSLSKYRLPIQHAYTGVPQHHSIVMTNTSSLPLTFDWAVKQLQHHHVFLLQKQLQQQPAAIKPMLADANASLQQPALEAVSSSGPNSSHVPEAVAETQSSLSLPASNCGSPGQIQLQISPSTGQLQPGDSIRLQLQLEPTAVGPVTLLCCCRVPAMSQLVGFVLTAQVGGLQVQYSIMQPEELPWQAQQQQQPPKHAGRRSSSPSGRRASSPSSRRSSSPSEHRASSPSGRRGDSQSRQASAAAASAQPGGQHLVQFGSSKFRAASPSAGRYSSPPRSIAAGAGADGAASTAPAASWALAADFGVVSLHQPAELLLQVTNLTSIPSTVTAWMGHFAAQQSLAASRSLGSCLAGGSSSPWPFASADPSAEDVQHVGAGTHTAAWHGGSSPVRSAGSQQPELQSRSSRTCSPSLTSHRRLSSPQAKGHISAALVAGRLSRTDPCTYTGSRVDSSATIPPDALITTISSISPSGSKQATGLTNSSLLASSSTALKGPFRAFPGNAMMAARQAAAAATAALGSGSLGCAVQLLPEACQLPGWGSCVVRLQAFNNLPGSYVDTLFVQVGDLPPQQIPMTLQVVGTPLVVSKHRVQRQGSDVPHALMHHQHQLPQPQSSTDAADATRAGHACSNIPDIVQDSRAACTLDFGVITAGMEVQKTFFVSNTGSLPVQLSWDWPPPKSPASTADDSSSRPDTALSAAGPDTDPEADTDMGLLPGSDTEQGGAADSRPEAAALPDTASKRPSSTSSSKSGNLARGTSAKGAAGQSKSGKAPAAGSMPAAAAASQTGAKQAAAAKARPSVSAASAAGKKSARGDLGSSSEAAAVEQHEAGSTAAVAAAASSGEGTPALTASNPDAPHGSEEAAAAPEAGAKRPDLLSVVGCDDFLPPGGPSSLLETFKPATSPAADTAAGQEGAGSPTAAAPAGAAAGPGTVDAASLFNITPAACVIPAGSQQQFVVSFCSNAPTVVQQLLLQGRQTLCWPEDSAGQEGCLKLHMLPGKGCGGNSSSSSSSSKEPAAESKPMQCQITGGFHPHAGPPPRPMPLLAVALSAAAVVPQLSATDPELFSWCVATTHEPGTHPSYLQTATLCNHTGCPQVFRLAVEGPFQLVAAVPSVAQDVDAFRGMLGSASLPSKSSSAAAKKSNRQDPTDRLLLLPPGEALDVSIRFMPAPWQQSLQARTSPAGTRPASGCSTSRSSSIQPAGAGTMPASGSSTSRSSSTQRAGAGPAASNVRQAQHGGEQLMDAPSSTTQHGGALTVTFSTGQQQVVPLRALVLQPELLVSPSSKVDVGSVHPAAPRTLELVLTNPSEADAAWEASVIQQRPSVTTIAQQPGLLGTAAFTVMPRAGVLQGRGLGIMPRQARLQVVFEPVSSGASVAELQLRVRGGRTVVVVLRGEGVHAEGAELRVGHDL